MIGLRSSHSTQGPSTRVRRGRRFPYLPNSRLGSRVRVEEIVFEVNGERLEAVRHGTRTASMHPDDGDPARTADHGLEAVQIRNPAVAGFKR